MSDNNTPKKMYSIEEAAKFLGMRAQYVRTLIRAKKLPSVKVSISENLWRHEIPVEALETRKAAGTTRGRKDGRGKYFVHATKDQLAQLIALVEKAGLDVTLAPAYDRTKAKAQYARQKAARAAKKATAKNGTLKAVVEKKA